MRRLEKRPYVESFKNTIELKGALRADIAERFIALDSAVHNAAFRSLAATEKAYALLEERTTKILIFLGNIEPHSHCHSPSKHFFCTALAIENSIAKEKKRAVNLLLAIVSGTCNITLHNICNTWLVDDH
jgi:hypothetical protein